MTRTVDPTAQEILPVKKYCVLRDTLSHPGGARQHSHNVVCSDSDLFKPLLMEKQISDF